MQMVTSALVTLPIALFGNAAAGLITSGGATGLPPSPTPHATDPSGLGATGALPHDSSLSQIILHDANNPALLAKDVGPAANLPSGPLGIPGIVLDAYLRAQQALAAQDPGCKLPWWLLAGIGKVESNQAENGEVAQNGDTLRPILGPLLDGSNGFAAVPDTDGGAMDGNASWDRAVGPMQFLPSTWRRYGGSGNPNNVYDAAQAAGKYLCASGLDLSNPANQAIAVFSYNHSDSYVQLVLIWADAYAHGVRPLPETPVSAIEASAPVNPAGGVLARPVTPGGAPPGTQTPIPGGGGPTTSTGGAAPPPSSGGGGTPAGGSGGGTTTTTTPPSTTTPPPPTTCTTTPTSTTAPTSTTTPTPTPTSTTTTTPPPCP